MQQYEKEIREELLHWQQQMLRRPSLWNRAAKGLQNRFNHLIPERVHQGITVTIKQMVRGVLLGAEKMTAEPLQQATLAMRETLVFEKIRFYQKTAAAEGGITGAGGILMGLADFPLLLALKLKLLFDIASLYGFSTRDYKERIYLLHIFQLAFSSQAQRRDAYLQLAGWTATARHLPNDIHAFDWRSFQQEYRDYLDLAKLAQLIPIIGAPIGAVVNYRLVKQLGVAAMNAYRMRWFENDTAYAHVID